jgi:carbonic anhydrase
VASNSEDELRDKVGASAGKDASWMRFGVIEDQVRTLRADVARVRSHPLIATGTLVGGFIYDVDTGLLSPVD